MSRIVIIEPNVVVRADLREIACATSSVQAIEDYGSIAELMHSPLGLTAIECVFLNGTANKLVESQEVKAVEVNGAHIVWMGGETQETLPQSWVKASVPFRNEDIVSLFSGPLNLA